MDAANITLSGTAAVIESLDTSNNTQVTIDATLGSIAAGGTLALLANRNFTAVANASTFADAGDLAVGGGTVSAKALAISTTGTVAGDGTINAPITDNGKIIATKSILALNGPVSGTGGLVIDAKSELLLAGASSSGTSITFSGTMADLTLDQPAEMLGTLVSLAPSDTIDLVSLAATSVAIKSGHLVISLTEGGTLSYVLSSPNALDRVETVTDNHGGTDIVIFGEASATVTPTPLNLGIVHAGQTISRTLTISNTAAAGHHSENLDASFSGTTGDFTASGGVTALIAGRKNTTSLTVTMQAGTADIETGKATLGLISDGSTIDTLGTAELAGQTVTLIGTINNYATAAIETVSGTAVLTGSGSTFHLNRGSVTQGSAAVTENIGIRNSATGPADNLDGSLSLTGTTGFINTGVGAFSNEAAGTADTAPIITLTTGMIGIYTETIVVSSAGTNSSGYSGALTAETLIVTGTIAAGSAKEHFTRTQIHDLAPITASSMPMRFVVPTAPIETTFPFEIRPAQGAWASIIPLNVESTASFSASPKRTDLLNSTIAPTGQTAAFSKIISHLQPTDGATSTTPHADIRTMINAWRSI